MLLLSASVSAQDIALFVNRQMESYPQSRQTSVSARTITNKLHAHTSPKLTGRPCCYPPFGGAGGGGLPLRSGNYRYLT